MFNSSITHLLYFENDAYCTHEQEKHSAYEETIQEVEHGCTSLTSNASGMGKVTTDSHAQNLPPIFSFVYLQKYLSVKF